MNQLVIPIHSFVDLITNSSTEIYVEANKETISTTKAIINAFLKIGGSELKADDLFTFELKTDCTCVEDGCFDSEEEECTEEEHRKNCERAKTEMIVTAKNATPHLKKAEELLNNMDSLFDYREYSGY